MIRGLVFFCAFEIDLISLPFHLRLLASSLLSRFKQHKQIHHGCLRNVGLFIIASCHAMISSLVHHQFVRITLKKNGSVFSFFLVQSSFIDAVCDHGIGTITIRHSSTNTTDLICVGRTTELRERNLRRRMKSRVLSYFKAPLPPWVSRRGYPFVGASWSHLGVHHYNHQ